MNNLIKNLLKNSLHIMKLNVFRLSVVFLFVMLAACVSAQTVLVSSKYGLMRTCEDYGENDKYYTL